MPPESSMNKTFFELGAESAKKDGFSISGRLFNEEFREKASFFEKLTLRKLAKHHALFYIMVI